MKINPSPCNECGHSHGTWDPSCLPLVEPWAEGMNLPLPQLAEMEAVRILLRKIEAAPPLTDERVDCFRELGELVLQNLGPLSMAATRPRWRSVLLHKFNCFRLQMGSADPSRTLHFSAPTRRRFRDVAKRVMEELQAGSGWEG
jgi:hypothetical protein